MESYDGAEVLGLDPGIERAWRDGLKPDPLLSTRVEDCYLVLSQRASSEPGRWRTERTPYLKEMMDCRHSVSVGHIAIDVLAEHRGVIARILQPGRNGRLFVAKRPEIWAFQIQSMIAQHLAVIAHEDDQRLLALAAAVQRLHHAADLLVNLIAHGQVGRPHQTVIVRAHIGKWIVVRDPIGKKRIWALCRWHYQPGGGPEYCQACRDEGLPCGRGKRGQMGGSAPTASTP
jgi:hypothetical protein